MDEPLNEYLERGDYFLLNYLEEIQEIFQYLSKEKINEPELKHYAKRGLSNLKPCIKWADELHKHSV